MIEDINKYEKSVCSQNGEDGIIEAIFNRIGTTNKYFVEFGVDTVYQCNTWKLSKEGWNGLRFDGITSDPPRINKEFITKENVNDIFKKYNVPQEFDLLSIDIDGNDYWVWKELKYSPRVVVIEYNSHIPSNESKVIMYDPNFQWKKDDYYGASLSALSELGASKGYCLVGCDSKGINAFFVRGDFVMYSFLLKPLYKLWNPPKFGKYKMGHPKSNRNDWIDV